MARLYGFSLSSLNETRRVGEGCLGILYIAQRLANDLFGDAGTLAALGCDAGCFAHLTIAAAAFIDSIANLAVGDTLAKTDVHKALPVHFVDGWDANQNENNCQIPAVGDLQKIAFFQALVDGPLIEVSAARPGARSVR